MKNSSKSSSLKAIVIGTLLTFGITNATIVSVASAQNASSNNTIGNVCDSEYFVNMQGDQSTKILVSNAEEIFINHYMLNTRIRVNEDDMDNYQITCKNNLLHIKVAEGKSTFHGYNYVIPVNHIVMLTVVIKEEKDKE